MSQGSITTWIAELKAGDSAAARALWQVYFPRLVALARVKLSTTPKACADEEDVALSAFKSLCFGAQEGRFSDLHDRDNLWPLLVVITSRKSLDQRRYVGRQRRGGKAVFAQVELVELLGSEPTPEFAALAVESCERLLGTLQPQLRQVAELKLIGHTNAETAAALDCGLRTVERRLELIRRVWENCDEGV